MKKTNDNQVVTEIDTLSYYVTKVPDKIDTLSYYVTKRPDEIDTLPHYLAKVHDEGLEEPTTPNDWGVSNGTLELSAAQGVDFQNLQTEQADPFLGKDFYFITDDASDDPICIADFIGTLPYILSEVHDKGLEEPAINSLGFQVAWWEYLQVGSTDLSSSSEDANDVEYHMCIADLIDTLPCTLAEVHDAPAGLNSLGFPKPPSALQEIPQLAKKWLPLKILGIHPKEMVTTPKPSPTFSPLLSRRLGVQTLMTVEIKKRPPPPHLLLPGDRMQRKAYIKTFSKQNEEAPTAIEHCMSL